MTASTRPIHSRQRAGVGRSSSSVSSSPVGLRVRAMLRARRAGTSRVRSVPEPRRARPAGRTAAARRAPTFARRFWRTRSRQSSSSSACSAAPAPLARNFGAAVSSFCARRTSSAERSHGARRRLGVGEHDGALGVVGRVFEAARAPSGAREQRRGEQGESERPFQPLRQHGIGEPGREQLALPSPAAKRRAPGARRQGAPGEGKDLRRGERRRSVASGARLGGVDRLLQRLVMRDPQNLGGGVERRTPMPRRACGQFPPGEQTLARGSRIGPRPGEMEGVAQRRLVLGPAGAAHTGGGGAERQAPTENAGPGRVFADDRVEAGKRRAGQKGGFGFLSGALTARAQAGNDGGEAAGRLWIPCKSARASIAKRYPVTALLARPGA